MLPGPNDLHGFCAGTQIVEVYLLTIFQKILRSNFASNIEITYNSFEWNETKSILQEAIKKSSVQERGDIFLTMRPSSSHFWG